MNEKITDAIRNFFEKITGYVSLVVEGREIGMGVLMASRKKVPAKFSN